MDRLYKDTKETKKIRVGYMSQDFCDHPVGRFIRPIIRDHENEKLSIYCINTGDIEDNMTRSIRSSCNYWIDISNKEEKEATQIIGDLKLDIIVELGGYTGGSRLNIMCRKCAPIQLSYLGYFANIYKGNRRVDRR